MKDQVLSIDQMQHLRDLGVDTSKASLYWARRCHGSKLNDNSIGKWFLSLEKEFMVVGFTAYEVIPAFTLQDLLSIIPSKICSKSHEIFSLRSVIMLRLVLPVITLRLVLPVMMLKSVLPVMIVS